MWRGGGLALGGMEGIFGECPPPPSKHAMPWVVQLVSISKCGGK